MSSPFTEINIEIGIGTTIYSAVEKALKLSEEYDCVVTFKFNDVKMFCDHRQHKIEDRVGTYLKKSGN